MDLAATLTLGEQLRALRALQRAAAVLGAYLNPPTPSAPAPAAAAAAAAAAPLKADSTWECPTCTFRNGARDAAQCVLCESPRPSEASPLPAHGAGAGVGSWQGGAF